MHENLNMEVLFFEYPLTASHSINLHITQSHQYNHQYNFLKFEINNFSLFVFSLKLGYYVLIFNE